MHYVIDYAGSYEGTFAATRSLVRETLYATRNAALKDLAMVIPGDTEAILKDMVQVKGEEGWYVYMRVLPSREGRSFLHTRDFQTHEHDSFLKKPKAGEGCWRFAQDLSCLLRVPSPTLVYTEEPPLLLTVRLLHPLERGLTGLLNYK